MVAIFNNAPNDVHFLADRLATCNMRQLEKRPNLGNKQQ